MSSPLSLCEVCVCACPVFFYIYRLCTHLVVLALPLVFFFFLLHLFFFFYLIKKKVLCPLSPLFSFLVWTWTLSSSLVGKDFLCLCLSFSFSSFLRFPAHVCIFFPQEHATFCVLCFCVLFFLVCGDSSVVSVSLFSWLFPFPPFVYECLFLVFVFVFLFVFVLFTFHLCSVSSFLTTVFYWVSLFFFFFFFFFTPLLFFWCFVVLVVVFFFSEKMCSSFFCLSFFLSVLRRVDI